MSQTQITDEDVVHEKTKVFKPKVILLDLHGTIIPVRTEEEVIIPFVKENLLNYLTENWNDTNVTRCVDGLTRQSFEQHFIFEHEDAPIIGKENQGENISNIISSVNEFVKWQIEIKRPTTETYILQHLCSKKAFHDGKIKIKLFDDIVPNIKRFTQLGIQICLFSSLDNQTLMSYLGNTINGNIIPLFDKIFDKTIGDKKDKNSYINIAVATQVEPKDILFVTDFGQEAKAGKSAGIENLLISRPGNRRIREYYLTSFNRIYSLNQIEFVDSK